MSNTVGTWTDRISSHARPEERDGCLQEVLVGHDCVASYEAFVGVVIWQELLRIHVFSDEVEHFKQLEFDNSAQNNSFQARKEDIIKKLGEKGR